MVQKSMSEAMVETLYQKMRGDPSILLIGSAYLLGPGLVADSLEKIREEFGHRLIDEPPIAEAAIASLGIGAAMAGARPFVHFGRASFAYEALSQIISEAAVAHYITGGQVTVPVVMHMYHGLSPIETAQHCHSPQAMFWNSPGLEIVLPSTPRDMKGLLSTAIKSNNPTIILNHTSLMANVDDVPEGDFEIPFGVADIKRRGTDATIFATSATVATALAAAQALADQSISAEVIDPRTLVPFDKFALITSLKKTGRLVVADETNQSCGVTAEIAAIAASEAFSYLKAPVERLGRPDVPVPTGVLPQSKFTPSCEQIVAAVKRTLK